MSRATTYLLHCVPGLEEIVADELKRSGIEARITQTLARFDERTSLLIVNWSGPPSELLRLRTVEDVFILTAKLPDVRSSRAPLQAIRQLVEVDSQVVSSASTVQRLRPARGRPTWRVVARMSGNQTFRRVDLQRAVEEGVAKRLGGWRHVADDAQLELWAHLVGKTFLLGARISDAGMRHRTYLAVSRPAALKPTIAAAMVFLTTPQPEDVFLDPMCGAGTVLMERAETARYEQLWGGDNDPEAVAAARENIGSRYKPIEIKQWDATRLPFAQGEISALACNLPFGKQIGTREQNRALYPALISEWARVVQPGGRLVLLSSESRLLESAVRREKKLARRRSYRVMVRGVLVTMSVIDRN